MLDKNYSLVCRVVADVRHKKGWFHADQVVKSKQQHKQAKKWLHTYCVVAT